MIRKFDGFKTAITDPAYFFGRTDFLKIMHEAPFQVRILLGGRRIGKTSTLQAVEWSFLDPEFHGDYRAFPVLVNLQLEQPQNADNFRYILIARLRESMERWKQTKLSKLRETYQSYLQQLSSAQISLGPFFKLNINNPAQERRLVQDDFRHILSRSIEELREDLHFDGVCFLLDEAEFVVIQEWGDDAWSYLRGIKDSDRSLKSLFGVLLSGYRGLKNYEQEVGSPLSNIADIHWLCSLSESETRNLITFRATQEQIKLNDNGIPHILEVTGCHPFLVQQFLNILFDCHHSHQSFSLEALMQDALWQQSPHFSSWWNSDGTSDGFGDDERTVYRALLECREGEYGAIAEASELSENSVRNALQVLAGTGVIKQTDKFHYEISGRLFEEWVRQLR